MIIEIITIIIILYSAYKININNKSGEKVYLDKKTTINLNDDISSLIVAGQEGTGKSTILRFLLLQMLHLEKYDIYIIDFKLLQPESFQLCFIF